MGLDLVCERTSIKMGSYTGVHIQRAGFLRAHAHLSRHRGQKDLAREILATLTSKEEIEYEAVYRLRKKLLPGIFCFVYQSDCEGAWTAEEAKEILRDLRLVLPFVQQGDALMNYREEDGSYHLEPILEEAIRTGIDITFC